ncbi:MAG: SpaA isopeptide-forming pilin-related protein [Lawsonibacter sp.]|nr:SpaA isopeptide-forming pilin-related protein [Lawsonibacter sp.]
MQKTVKQMIQNFTRQRTQRRRAYAAFTTLAILVSITTMYSLSQPASTMTGELICGQEEHIHTDACYTEKLICGLEEQTESVEDAEEHVHDESCYEPHEVLVCTEEEAEAHSHDESCYGLVCGETEYPAHTHGDDCYAVVTETCGQEEHEAHSHDESCYTTTRSLTCGEAESAGHTHDDSCYDESTALACGQSESAGHTHDDSCTVRRVELTCTAQEGPGHVHDDSCYGLICGKEETEGHIHTEECYETRNELICTAGHVHTADCYEKVLTCELPEHIHNSTCYAETQPEAPDESEYICGLPAHTHDDSCLDEEGNLICGLEEHVHDETCVVELPETDLQELTDDGAFVRELKVSGGEIISGRKDLCPLTVRNQEIIEYEVSVETESYTDTSYGAGRVRLEVVLPLTEEEAGFDLAAMPWMDDSEGYEPSVMVEDRLVGEEERPCQVLTAYKSLVSQEDSGEAVIPGGFTETVAVSVHNMEPGKAVMLQVSAAMEYSTWDGCCETHETEERLTVLSGEFLVTASVSEEELQAVYEDFLAELEDLETLDEADDDVCASANDLLQRIQEAYQQGLLRTADYEELCARGAEFTVGDVNSIAEAAEGTNWMSLRDSGWFEEYSDYDGGSSSYTLKASRRNLAAENSITALADPPPSDVQVEDRGGSNTSEDGAVTVSKTISGTELENVFDITLQVQTSMSVEEIREEPDMAVVIVMDISNTMNSNFGRVTRYAAAMTAAENFLDNFAENNSLGISKVGYVAFNTDAHQIFGLQACSTQEQANNLKNTMRTQTGSIINGDGYDASHSRFTNVEAGLAMASDMLNGVSNQNKYIIFLSDGFPTTYISSGYSGYDPYDSTGRFYDHVLNKKCLYGTSYSDEAAIRARKKAENIKGSGTTIFSIGVDVAGQTIKQYITQSEKADGFSVVDRTKTTYEIGDASSTEAYKNWLKESIGSGYYYDSTDSTGLKNAYDQIFKEIKHQVEVGSAADWVASDPIPTVSGSVETVEFIAFYNKSCSALVEGDLTGTYTADGENTAAFDSDKNAISWDLKRSGYTTASNDSKTVYTYQLVYRVRLKNEAGNFGEGTIYPTNDTTTLQYRNIQGTDGNLTVSDPKTVEFPIPSVHGYLTELTFRKVDTNGNGLAGAEFTLSHDTRQCQVCRGDRTGVDIADQTASSDTDGTVTFSRIPSGHKYTLKETKVPDGYSANGDTYQVDVAYDVVTVTVTAHDGTAKDWDGTIVNNVYCELPNTGGMGTQTFTFLGMMMMLSAGVLLMIQRRRREGI